MSNPTCPFDGPHDYAPTDSCPVCGDLGTLPPFGEYEPPSRCVADTPTTPAGQGQDGVDVPAAPVDAREAPRDATEALTKQLRNQRE